ncbi:MAG: class II fructose-bisphosphate aldolase [bacterium]
MPLVTTKGMLLDAHKKNYAVGAFNANNLEMAQGIVAAAEEENAPVIVEVSQGGLNHGGIAEMSALIRALAEKANVPVALHLDHGMDFFHNILCLREQFTSLMFDGSQLSYEENVAITKDIVKIAHMVNIPVEAELGKVPKDPDEMNFEELKQYMTEPDEALNFVEQTGIDFLAVSVGSMHKMKVREAILEIDRIKNLRETVDVPLVLHGSSGVDEDSVKKSIKAGISKINVHTYLAQNFTRGMKKYLNENPDAIDLRKYMSAGREALKEAVRHKIRLFNSHNKADKIGKINVDVKSDDIERVDSIE